MTDMGGDVSQQHLSSPLLLKHQRIYDENPDSRVFAVLAESYRKVGMIDEAVTILEKGVTKHRDYMIAHLILGSCYFEQGNYTRAERVLAPFIQSHWDNFKLHRMYGEILLSIGDPVGALESLKHALYLNPYDEEIPSLMSELEDASELAPAILNDDPEVDSSKGSSSLFDVEKIKQDQIEESDEWVQVSFPSTDQKSVEDDLELSVQEWKERGSGALQAEKDESYKLKSEHSDEGERDLSALVESVVDVKKIPSSDKNKLPSLTDTAKKQAELTRLDTFLEGIQQRAKQRK